MKKNKISKILFALAIPVIIIGCDGDDETATTHDFASIATGFSEEDGSNTVTIPFRNVSSISESDLTISGTAVEGEDFNITSVTSEGIQIELLDDVTIEELETARIQLHGSEGNAIHNITFVDNDPGVFDIDLTWAAGITAVDMDLLLWKYDEAADEWVDVSQSWGSTFEHLQINWDDEDGIYGLTYNYYNGNTTPLDFTVAFTPSSGVTIDGVLNARTYNVSYTLANEDKTGNYHIVQTFRKNGLTYTEFSDVEVPAAGSRSKTMTANLNKAAAAKYQGK
jgi:hypothetical protein